MAQRKLLLPTADARKRLNEQIEKGRQLLSQSIRTYAALKEYKLDRLRYTQYNIEMLNALFGEDEDAFWRYKISSPEYGVRFEEELEFYRSLDREQVNELRALEESLELMSKTAGTPSLDRPKSDVPTYKSWRQKVEEHPFTLGIMVCLATATLVISIMVWVNSARIDNIVSKYQADESNMRAQYETQIRELQARVRELESKKVSVKEK